MRESILQRCRCTVRTTATGGFAKMVMFGKQHHERASLVMDAMFVPVELSFLKHRFALHILLWRTNGIRPRTVIEHLKRFHTVRTIARGGRVRRAPTNGRQRSQVEVEGTAVPCVVTKNARDCVRLTVEVSNRRSLTTSVPVSVVDTNGNSRTKKLELS